MLDFLWLSKYKLGNGSGVGEDELEEEEELGEKLPSVMVWTDGLALGLTHSSIATFTLLLL